MATPCRHGPPLSRPVAGPVIGFHLTPGDGGDRVWMTGDTVLHRPLRRAARALEVDVLLLHLGRVRFPVTGPLRYSMDGADALEVVDLVRPRVVVPVHYEGWSHFSEPEQHLRDTVSRAPAELRDLFTWPDRGTALVL